MRVETWGPFLFVCLDPSTPPLSHVLGSIPEETRHLPLEHMTLFKKIDYEVACNWKVYVDNYLEGYHIPIVHPELFQEIDYRAYKVETAEYHSKQHAPIRSKSEESLYRRNLPDGASPEALYYWVFPNLMLNLYPDNLQTNIILPLSARAHADVLRVVRARAQQPRRRGGVRALVRLQRPGPAGGHRDLRGGAEGPALAHLRPGTILGAPRERRAPLPRVVDAGAALSLTSRISFERSAAGSRPAGLHQAMGFRDVLFFLVTAGTNLQWVATAAAGGASAVTVWIIGFLAMALPLATAVIAMSSRHPEEGGLYVWSKIAFGDFAGFLTGWAYWMSNLPYFPAVLYFAAGNALYAGGSRWIGLSRSASYFIAASLVGLLLATVLNLVGLEIGKWLSNVGAIARWLATALLVVLGVAVLARFGSATRFSVPPLVPGTHLKDVIFWSTIAFAMTGLESASFMGSEIRERGARRAARHPRLDADHPRWSTSPARWPC